MVVLEVYINTFYNTQLNEMAKDFVKIFNRDYIHMKNLTAAVTVMKQFPGWFNDYNENHPHKGLEMMPLMKYNIK